MKYSVKIFTIFVVSLFGINVYASNIEISNIEVSSKIDYVEEISNPSIKFKTGNKMVGNTGKTLNEFILKNNSNLTNNFVN